MATRTHNIKYPQVSRTSSEFFAQIEFDNFQRSLLKIDSIAEEFSLDL